MNVKLVDDELCAATTVAAEPPWIDADTHALFLDLDGTLVAIRERPELVSPEPALIALLARLNSRFSGAVAVLTGRALVDAEQILAGGVDFIAGVHGREWRRRDAVTRCDVDELEAWSAARAEIARFAESVGASVLVEDKVSALALHYRQAPQLAESVVRAVEAIAALHGLRAVHGKCVSEIMPPGATKGDALRMLMSEAPFARRKPVAVGDDVTDEDAFAAANALGGWSVRVGRSRGATQARFALPDFGAVRCWLDAAL